MSSRSLIHGLFLLLALTALQGCAGKKFTDIQQGIETRGHYIEDVPFFRQAEYDCGPAALASVLSHWGRPRSMEEIIAGVYTPKLRGTLTWDMERFAGETGLKTESTAGARSLESLKTPLRNDVPVICLLDLGFGPYKQPHYVVVIGFDDVHAVLIMHDGRTSNRLMSYDKFDRTWSRAGKWMLVVKP